MALLAATLGALAFACGSNDVPAPAPCEGASCIDGGDSESSTPEGSTSDGPPSDAPDAGGDAGACRLEAPDGDAGPSGTLQWELNFGVSGYTFPSTIARDPANGDIVVTGYLWGTTDFGGGPLTSQAANDGTGSDVFVARFDRSGTYKWAGAWGNGSSVAANTIAVGPSGEMVVSGILREGSLDFGNGCAVLTSTGSPDIFVVKLDAAGACVWTKRFGVVGETQNVNSVAIDAAGSVLLGGIARGGLDLGGGARTGFLLAKLTAAGGHAWSKAFTASTVYGGPWLTLDRQGNAIVAGSFSKMIDLGGGPLSTAGSATGDTTHAAFAAKFDTSGSHLWSHQYGEGVAAKNASISGVATDSCGSVLVHGPFGGAINFGSGALAAADTTKSYAFLARLASGGNGTWSTSFVASNGGGAPAFALAGIAVDSAGGVTIAPALPGGVGFQSTADFGGGALTGNTGNGAASIAVASFDAAANYRWSYAGGSPSTARASVAAYPLGVAAWGSSVALAGTFTKCLTLCATSPPATSLVLAGKTLTAVSGQDLFLASFTP